MRFLIHVSSQPRISTSGGFLDRGRRGQGPVICIMGQVILRRQRRWHNPPHTQGAISGGPPGVVADLCPHTNGNNNSPTRTKHDKPPAKPPNDYNQGRSGHTGGHCTAGWLHVCWHCNEPHPAFDHDTYKQANHSEGKGARRHNNTNNNNNNNNNDNNINNNNNNNNNQPKGGGKGSKGTGKKGSEGFKRNR
jgi:hypothetical protein